MAPKSSTSSSTKSTNITNTLAMTKAIQTIGKNQEIFAKAVETCQSLVSETFGDLEMRLIAKSKELEDLEIIYSQEKKNKQVETDLALKEYGYNKSVEIIGERGEIAISNVEYDRLTEELDALKQKGNSDINKAVEMEKRRHDERLTNITQTLELQKQAEVAKVEAQLETQINQIELLKSTITGLKEDLNAQRELTRDIAASASKSQAMYFPPGK